MSLLMEHNVPVYKEFCKCLEENHECILITATGTGKSYIVEEFLQQHNETALILVPTVAIKNSWESLSNRVSVVTYTMFSRRWKDFVGKYTYTVFDEAHHIGGSGPWSNAVRKYREACDESNYFIGLTANSVRYNDQNKDVAENEFHSHTVYGYDISEAIDKGILPHAHYISALFDLPTIRNSLYKKFSSNYSLLSCDRNAILELFGRLDMAMANAQSIQSILQFHIKDSTKIKAIVFVDSIRYVSKAHSIIQDAFKNEKILYVHSDLSKTENAETIEQFKSMSHGFIIAVDMFNEGLHIDGVNTIIMLRKTSSPNIYQQQIGRALSATDINKLVYIFDFVGNATAIANRLYGIEELNQSFRMSGKSKKSSSKYPIISDQIIVDDFTQDIQEIIFNISKLIKRKKSNHDLTDEQIKEILSECYTVDQVAKRFSIEADQAKELIIKYGENNRILIRNRPSRLSHEQIDSILDYAKQGYSIQKIKDTLGIGRNSIIKYLKMYGLYDEVIKNNSNANTKARYTEHDDEIFRMYYPLMYTQEFRDKYFPNTSLNGIDSHAYNLGLKKTYSKSKSMSIADEDIPIIERFYPKFGTSIIERLDLPYTQDQIKNYAQKHNLKSFSKTNIRDFILSMYDNGVDNEDIINLLKKKYDVVYSYPKFKMHLRRLIDQRNKERQMTEEEAQ